MIGNIIGIVIGLLLAVPFIISYISLLFNTSKVEKEKEMQHKMKEFDMKDIHSGYVVKFRNGDTALVMRVGAKFTKIFARVQLRELVSAEEGDNFFYTSSYKGPYHFAFDPICSRTKPDPDHDVVAVYGLVEGVNNYLRVGAAITAHRPLLWEENIKEMTLEEVEKALGHKVKIVSTEKEEDDTPIGIKGVDCVRCVHHSGHSGCKPYSMGCTKCKYELGLESCPCNHCYARNGEPCPNFKEG